MDDLLDTKEAAKYVTVGQSTLEHYRVSGRGPAFLKLGKSIVRYKKADLDRWVDECRYQSTSQVAA